MRKRPTGGLSFFRALALATVLAAGPLASAQTAGAVVPARFSPISVTYVSAWQGWALGTVPCGTGRCLSLLHTTDDGASWSSVPVPPSGRIGPDSAPLRARFADSEDGWIFSTLPGQSKAEAWSTHSGGRHWAAISFPVKSPYSAVEDIEAAAGVVHAAVQVGDGVEIFSSPVSRDHWHRTGGPFELGAGPVPAGELALQGRSGWFVQIDRVVVSGARLGPSGAWAGWRPPCSSAGGPAILAAPTASRVDAVCTEGVWTGPKVTVDLLASTDGGATFGPGRPVPGMPDLASAIGPSTVAVGASVTGTNSVGVSLEMSFDKGASWRSVYRHAGAGWLELGFTTSEQGVAIVLGAQDGDPNTMLFTTDGGRHWAPVSFR
jgi:hypothetical protein